MTIGSGSGTQVHSGVCNLCEAICGLTITTQANRVIDIRGDPDDPLSRGHVCPKSVALADIYNDPERLRRPLRRRGDTFEEIGWDEAIDLVTRRLVETRNKHGADSVAVYFGNPIVHSLGNMTHGIPFAEMLGTHNLYSASSMDQLPHHVVSWFLYGHMLLMPKPDLDRTNYLLIFGANPIVSNGSIMTAPDMRRRLREIRDRSGRVIVIDPRRTETADVADEHHFIRPGSDAAVLLAMVNVVLDERRQALPPYIDGVDELRGTIAGFTPEVASRYSGIPATEIRRLALDFADANGAACYGRMGASTQRFGTLTHYGIQLLNIVTNNLDRPGGTMFEKPAVEIMPLFDPGNLGARRSRVRGLPSFQAEFPVAALQEEITTPGEGQVRALFLVSGNPVMSFPDGNAMDDALKSLDFMVAIDFYVNESTRHADVILPPVSALERDMYDLVFRAFAIRNTAKYTEAVFPKPEGTRHDWEIYRALGFAYRRHLTGGTPLGVLRNLSVRNMITMMKLRLSPRRTVDLALRTGPYRLSIRKLLKQPAGIDLGAMKPLLPGRLQTKDHRIHLVPAPIAEDLKRLQADMDATPADSLVLIGRRDLRNLNSWMQNFGRLVAGPARHHLHVHPDDAARCGVENGPATLRSRTGEVTVDVWQTADVMPGTVSLPHGYGHDRSGMRLSVASKVPGVSLNALTDSLALDEISGNAAFSGIPVTLEPLRATDDQTAAMAATTAETS
ncbi:MAG: molybdopterin-dependent oxidoreductase [Candidatus Nanopelagicales bacterium]